MGLAIFNSQYLILHQGALRSPAGFTTTSLLNIVKERKKDLIELSHYQKDRLKSPLVLDILSGQRKPAR